MSSSDSDKKASSLSDDSSSESDVEAKTVEATKEEPKEESKPSEQKEEEHKKEEPKEEHKEEHKEEKKEDHKEEQKEEHKDEKKEEVKQEEKKDEAPKKDKKKDKKKDDTKEEDKKKEEEAKKKEEEAKKKEEEAKKKEEEEKKKKEEEKKKKEEDKKKKEEEKKKKEEEDKKKKEEEKKKKEEEKKKKEEEKKKKEEEAKKEEKKEKKEEPKKEEKKEKAVKVKDGKQEEKKEETKPEEEKEEVPEEKESGPTREESLKEAASKLDKEHSELVLSETSIAKDVVSKLLKLIKEKKEDADTITGALLCIKFYKEKSALRSVFRGTEGIPVIVDLLTSSIEGVRKVAIRFVGDLITKCGSSDNIANAEALHEAGAVAHIVKLYEDKETRVMAVGVIRILGSFENRTATSFQEEIRDANGLKPLVSFLKGEEEDLVLQAGSALRHLTEGNKDNQNLVLEENVVPLLLEVAEKSTNQKVQLNALKTIGAVVSGNEKGTKQVQVEGLKLLVKLLQNESPELQDAALQIVATVAAPSDVALYNADFQNALREVGVLDLVFKLLDSENENTLKSAANALSALCSGNEENLKVALSGDVLEKLLEQFKGNKSDKVKAASLAALTALIIKSTKTQENLIDKGILPDVVAGLESKSLEVQEASVEFLRQARGHDKVRNLLAEKLTVLIGLLSVSVSVSIQEASVSIIDTLIKEEPLKAALIKDKRSIPNLVALLEGTREKVIVRACSCIDRVVTKNTKQQEIVSKAGAPVKLVNLLGPYYNQTVKQHAVYAIWALSNGNSKVQSHMAKANAIKAIVELLINAHGSDLLKEYASGALFAIIQENSSNKKLLAQEKGVEALVPLLASTSDNQKANAAKAIWAACEGNTKNQEAAVAGLPELVLMLRSKNLSVQASAASAVWGLSVKNAKNQDEVRNAKALPELVDIVNWHVKEYLNDPNTHVAEGVALQAAVSAIAALTTKNQANVDAFKEYEAGRALDPLKDATNKFLRNEALLAMKNLGVVIKSRSGSIIDFFRRKSSGGEKDEKKEDKEEDKAEKKEEEKSEKSEEKKDEKKESDSSDSDSDEKKEEKTEDKKEGEVKTGEVKTEEVKKDEPKKDETKKDEPKKEEKKKEEEAKKKEEEKKKKEEEKKKKEEEAKKKKEEEAKKKEEEKKKKEEEKKKKEEEAKKKKEEEAKKKEEEKKKKEEEKKKKEEEAKKKKEEEEAKKKKDEPKKEEKKEDAKDEKKEEPKTEESKEEKKEEQAEKKEEKKEEPKTEESKEEKKEEKKEEHKEEKKEEHKEEKKEEHKEEKKEEHKDEKKEEEPKAEEKKEESSSSSDDSSDSSDE